VLSLPDTLQLDMEKWLKVPSLVALLAGAAVFSAVIVRPRFEQAREETQSATRAGEFRLAQRRSGSEDCLYAARIIYDVHWAAACLKLANQSAPGVGDSHAECDLPDAAAAVVNQWLAEAEQRCIAEP
jgi:hypothetical protein